jgi:hypothetical protein
MQKLKIPHAFQDILGTESTPTLPYTIPAFAAFIERWCEMEEEELEWYSIIQPGLAKLADYEQALTKTPAYILAMGMYIVL